MTIPGGSWQDKIKAHLKEHPGATARQMADAFSYDRKRITDATTKLLKKGEVERAPTGPAHQVTKQPTFAFYLSDTAPAEQPEPEAKNMDQRVTAPQPPKEGETWHDKIVAYVRANPGKTNIEISEGIGYDRMNVSSSTVSLWRAGALVRTEGPMSPKAARGGRRMQPLYYIKGAAPEGVPLIPLTTPKPRPTTVDKYNAAVRAAQGDRAAEYAAASDEGEQEAEEDASIARYEASQEPEAEAPEPQGALKVNESLAIVPSFESAIEKAATILADRIVTLALASIESRLDRYLPPPKAPENIEGIGAFYERRAPEKNGRPTALVVGLLPQQQAIIQSDFHRTLKLSFFKDGNLKLLQQKAESVEHVLVACDFVSHAMTDGLKNHREKTQLLRGGMGAVRDALGAIVTGA